MKKTIYAGFLSSQDDHCDIKLISMIIKDGVKDDVELARKYAACTTMTEEDSMAFIARMRERGKVGYYHQQWNEKDRCMNYLFTRWEPETDRFEPSRDYLRGKSYFKPLFRAKDATGEA